MLKIKQRAQSQAIRIALINKMSNVIRGSMDLSAILNSALSELSIMFGAYKAYYASSENDIFKIEEIYPSGQDVFSDNIEFDGEVLETISGGGISVQHVLREYLNAPSLKQPVMRIVVPVHHMQKLIGAIVLLSYQKQ